MKQYVISVAVIAVGIAIILCEVVMNAEKSHAGWFSSVDTFYDEATSVFCATRMEAVSCVYVPRDTVRKDGQLGD